MKLCYDYKTFSMQKYGGISRYFVELASRINRYPDTEVRVVSPLYQSRFLHAKKADIPVRGFHAEILAAQRRITAAINPIGFYIFSAIYKPDIVHETYYARRRSSSASAKTVITIYDTIEELFPEFFSTSQRTIEIRKEVCRRVDHFICISHNTREDLIRLYGVDPNKVSVVHLASSLCAPAQPPVRKTEPFFLYVGERAGYKNFLGLLTAFAQSQLYKTHQLVCFGGGALRPNEYNKIDELGVPRDRVVSVTGDDAKLASYYATAEAFVYPSLYEGFGIPLLEAMDCACPVLCGDTSSMPEVAGDAAMYFNARDTQEMAAALLKIVQSPEERRLLISKGRERVKQFSWDICAQQTYSVYERLLANQ
ncbi:MAG: glycosyltransferase family 1 protein [Acidobacteriaceae bacterium]